MADEVDGGRSSSSSQSGNEGGWAGLPLGIGSSSSEGTGSGGAGRKRRMCDRCGRPESACLCPGLPASPVDTETHVVIIQHPKEQERPMRTSQLIRRVLSNFTLAIGRRASTYGATEGLEEALADPSAVIVFPARQAIDLADYLADPERKRPGRLIFLDGTWEQALNIYRWNERLRDLPAVSFVPRAKSRFKIRKQPTPDAVCTLEAVAFALEAVEPDNTAAPAALLDALDYMVGMQFQRGRTEYSGMEHDDAEHDTGASHNGGQP